MATTVSEAEQIQEEMRHVRTELRDDVQEIVAGARVIADWRHYIREYPWIAVGAAAAVGFFVVPSRPVVIKPSTKDLIELAKAHKLFVDPTPQPQKKPGFLGSIAGFAASGLLQSALAVGSHQLDQFLKGLSSGQRPAQRPQAARGECQ